MVGRGVLRFKKGVCSKRVSGSVVLEASSSRARFICTTVVQIGVANEVPFSSRCTTISTAKKNPTGSLPPAVPLAITSTFRPCTHTSDDSYIYQLSLVVATATVSFIYLFIIDPPADG